MDDLTKYSRSKRSMAVQMVMDVILVIILFAVTDGKKETYRYYVDSDYRNLVKIGSAGVVVFIIAFVIDLILFIYYSSKVSELTAASCNPAPGDRNLRPCPDCGRMISRYAGTCPNCGRPMAAEELEPRLPERPRKPAPGPSGVVYCRSCGGIMFRGSGTCPKCGRAAGGNGMEPGLPETADWKCSGCGASNESDAVFCSACGVRRH